MANEKKLFYKGYEALTGEQAKAEKARLQKRAEKAAVNSGGNLTNEVFAAQDAEFREACERAGVSPTGRQASKYRRKMGLAYAALLTMKNAERLAAEG